MIADHSPDIAAGILVFDNWIANLDRHAGNLIFGKSIGAWLIDHEQSFGARQPMDLEKVDGCADDYHVFRGIQLPKARINEWVTRVRSLPTVAVDGAVGDAYVHRLLTAGERDAVKAWLMDRKRRVASIVKTFEERQVSRPVTPNDDNDPGGGLW